MDGHTRFILSTGPAMLRTAVIVFALSLGVANVQAQTSNAAASSDFAQQTLNWQNKRLAGLTAPNGWLSLIGLEWLKEGPNRLGTDPDNDIVLKAGPAHLGVVTLTNDGAMHLVLDQQSSATVDGKAVHEAKLIDDANAGDGGPTTVAFGSASFVVIERDGRKALRVRDSNAETRTHFAGLDYYPMDPSWRIEADWVPLNPPQELEIGSVLGTINKEKVPGKAVFHRDGHTYELMPIQEEPDSLFFVIADRTSGKETYGAARFMYADLPKNGKVVLDFNRAYNPPCAFTPYATCPLAPPENRMDLAVTAGEKKYKGGH
jgi:uncharacterized protein (DUF1684 family)